jgi:ATP-binding cassette subfamily B protein
MTTYLLQVVRPLELAGFAARDIGQGAAYLEALLAVLRHAAEPSGAAGPDRPAPRGPATLSFENVSFAFAPGRPILRDVTFEVTPGSLVAVVGPSGAGKSSLLRLILRFHDPTHGRILLDGVALPAWPLTLLRGRIALVSQDTILLNASIAENIGLAVDAPTEAAVQRAASVACLSDLLHALPEGLQTHVGERGLNLSGGEKQRVAIARAVLRQARLVICDEATAALDSETEQAVMDALSNLTRTATTLVATHRLASVIHADQILVLEHGAIVQRGRHDDLLARDGLYARLWRTQCGQAASVSID